MLVCKPRACGVPEQWSSEDLCGVLAQASCLTREVVAPGKQPFGGFWCCEGWRLLLRLRPLLPHSLLVRLVARKWMKKVMRVWDPKKEKRRPLDVGQGLQC